jgi:hypothetical protein
MAKKSLVVTSEAELRTKALELALHEAFQGVAAQDAPQDMPELYIDGERVLTILDGEKPKTL